MKLFTAGSFRYSKERIFQRLKILPENENVYEYANEVFPRLEEIARAEVELLCGYTVIPNTLELDSPEMDSCDLLAVCLAGCTDRIVNKVSAMMDEGEYLEGYILDDLANEILFNASDDMNCQLYEELKQQGYRLTSRFTPGENHLALEHQRTFLAILKEKKPDLPVALTEHYMLQPEKVMLYAYGGGKHLPERSITHDCASCSNVNCFYRSKK